MRRPGWDGRRLRGGGPAAVESLRHRGGLAVPRRKSPSIDAVKAFPFGSARQLARRGRTGTVSAVELLEAYLERVDRLNPAVNAIVVDDRARALKDARAA